MLALGMSAQEQSYYSGLSLVVPCIKISPEYQARIDRYKPYAKLINYVAPFYQFNERKDSDIKPWLQ